jgi:hypothetical protein
MPTLPWAEYLNGRLAEADGEIEVFTGMMDGVHAPEHTDLCTNWQKAFLWKMP